MKKIHRKIISSQARYIEKICSVVESITKSRKLIGGVNYCYSREERSDIRNFTPVYYKPHKIKSKLKSLNDFKKAAVRLIGEEGYKGLVETRKEKYVNVNKGVKK